MQISAKCRQGPLPSSSNRRPPTAPSPSPSPSPSSSTSTSTSTAPTPKHHPSSTSPGNQRHQRQREHSITPVSVHRPATSFPFSVPGRWPCTLSRFQHRSAPTSLRRCSALDGFHHHPSTTHEPASSPGPSPTTATIPSVLAPPTLLHTPRSQNDTQPARPQLALSVGGTARTAYYPTRRALPLLVVGLSLSIALIRGRRPRRTSTHLVRHRLPLSCRVISPPVGSLGSIASSHSPRI